MSDVAPLVFRIHQNALADSAALAAPRLLEAHMPKTTNKQMTIPRLVHQTGSRGLKGARLERLQAAVEQATDVQSELRTTRDQRLAHMDQKQWREGRPTSKGYGWPEIEWAYAAVIRVLHVFHREAFGVNWHPEPIDDPTVPYPCPGAAVVPPNHPVTSRRIGHSRTSNAPPMPLIFNHLPSNRYAFSLVRLRQFARGNDRGTNPNSGRTAARPLGFA